MFKTSREHLEYIIDPLGAIGEIEIYRAITRLREGNEADKAVAEAAERAMACGWDWLSNTHGRGAETVDILRITIDRLK